jgi:hypothetical protein
VGEAIAIDAEGNAYLAGTAQSGSPDFPTTAGAFQTNSCDGLFNDGFVAKVNPAGTGLVYCTFLCGTGGDSPKAIAVDSLGNAYVAGHTTSHDFPTANAFQPNHLGDVFTHAGFITKLNPSGTALDYSTYFIGPFGDTAVYAIAIDAQGNAFVTGETTGGTLPTTPGVVQMTAPFPSCRDGLDLLPDSECVSTRRARSAECLRHQADCRRLAHPLFLLFGRGKGDQFDFDSEGLQPG